MKTKTINKQIKMIKSKFVNTYDFVFNNKIIAQMEKTDEKFKGTNEYHLKFWSGYGFQNQDIWTGYTETKNMMIELLLKQIHNNEIIVNEHPNINEYYNNIKSIN